MNLLLLFDEDRTEGHSFEVEDDRARHLTTVLRVTEGDSVRAGLLGGGRGEAKVTRVAKRSVRVEVQFDERPIPLEKTTLILAVPRPKSLKKLLPEIAAMGIERLVLTRSWRVQKPYLTSKLLEPAGYRPLIHLGMMQAGLTTELQVIVARGFRAFFEDEIEAALGTARRLVMHPYADHVLRDVQVGEDEPLQMMVGPEGGLIASEIETLEAAGFSPVRMGPRILRVETACVAALAQLELLRSS